MVNENEKIIKGVLLFCRQASRMKTDFQKKDSLCRNYGRNDGRSYFIEVLLCYRIAMKAPAISKLNIR